MGIKHLQQPRTDTRNPTEPRQRPERAVVVSICDDATGEGGSDSWESREIQLLCDVDIDSLSTPEWSPQSGGLGLHGIPLRSFSIHIREQDNATRGSTRPHTHYPDYDTSEKEKQHESGCLAVVGRGGHAQRWHTARDRPVPFLSDTFTGFSGAFATSSAFM